MRASAANRTNPMAVRQFVLLACGFRPFFLLAGFDALINMGVWLAVFVDSSLWPARALPAMYWHAHEMLFGFASAAIAGFLLTAVPGWTGRTSYSGAPLISLIALWFAGRLAMAPFGLLPPMAADAIDLAFFPAMILILAPPLVRAVKFRNLPFVGILTLFFLANLCFHLGANGVLAAGEQIGLGIAIDVVMILIVIIGGRIIPTFTKSGLARHGIVVQLQGNRCIEIFSIASIVAVLLADLAMPLSAANGAVALAAAVAQTIRLARWHGHRTPDLGSPSGLCLARSRIAAQGDLAAHRRVLRRKMDSCPDHWGFWNYDSCRDDACLARPYRPRLNCLTQNYCLLCSHFDFGVGPRFSSGCAHIPV
jgi:uncharacterized protein involved in response to NO